MKIKELDMVTLTGTVVHIYKGGKICEVELDTPHHIFLHTTKPVLMTCMMSMLSKVPSSHKNQKTKTKKGQ